MRPFLVKVMVLSKESYGDKRNIIVEEITLLLHLYN